MTSGHVAGCSLSYTRRGVPLLTAFANPVLGLVVAAYPSGEARQTPSDLAGRVSLVGRPHQPFGAARLSPGCSEDLPEPAVLAAGLEGQVVVLVSLVRFADPWRPAAFLLAAALASGGELGLLPVNLPLAVALSAWRDYLRSGRPWQSASVYYSRSAHAFGFYLRNLVSSICSQVGIHVWLLPLRQ